MKMFELKKLPVEKDLETKEILKKLATAHRALAELKGVAKLLIAGIAKPEPFFAYLHESNDTILTYSDHHDFSENDIQTIKKLTKNKIIITTEKDYVRLKDRLNSESLFYLPIKTALVSQGSMFDSTLLNYVGTSTRNG